MKLMLMDPLSTKTSRARDVFLLALYEDIKVPGTDVVIPKGCRAAGTVMVVKNYRQFRNAAGIGIELNVLILPDGSEVLLTSTKKLSGKSYFYTIKNIDPPRATAGEVARNTSASDLKAAMDEIAANLKIPTGLTAAARDAQIAYKKVFSIDELLKFYKQNGGEKLAPVLDLIKREGLASFLKNLSWKRADVVYTAVAGIVELYNGYKSWIAKQERYIHPGAVLEAATTSDVVYTYSETANGDRAQAFDH
ncbi:MAG: hypothetical protein U0R49_11725 [Fimbriimonadales bacterium]